MLNSVYHTDVRLSNRRLRWTAVQEKAANGTKPLTFASPEDLLAIMGLTPGSVTPLGVLNDTELKVHAFIDKDFLAEPQIIGVHPNDNTATVWLKAEELIRLMREHGNTVDAVELSY